MNQLGNIITRSNLNAPLTAPPMVIISAVSITVKPCTKKIRKIILAFKYILKICLFKTKSYHYNWSCNKQ